MSNTHREILERLYDTDRSAEVQPQRFAGTVMPRIMELAVQKFLEPLIDEVVHDDTEINLKFLNSLVSLCHTVYAMGWQDGSRGRQNR